jgi:hypothetical protein
MHSRRGSAAMAAIGLAVLAGCGGDDTDSTGPAAEQWSAALAGSSEVPAVTTTATGTASFEAVGDTAIRFSVSVNGLTGATMGHIHSGAAGVNGGILVWLLPANGTAAQAPAPQLTGVIASSTINASWVRGTTPISLDSLKALMRARNVYVNVHTSAFGGGEIRGQIGPTP